LLSKREPKIIPERRELKQRKFNEERMQESVCAALGLPIGKELIG
jgi:hypothetical protein